MPAVSFTPSGRTIVVEPGTLLLDACRRAGFRIGAPCGGKGLCGKCRVRVLAGEIQDAENRRDCLPAGLLREGWRASCMVRVHGDLTVADPPGDAGDGVILTDFMAREPEIAPGVWQREVTLAPPSAMDRADDCSRLAAALDDDGEAYDMPLPLLAALPAVLRGNGFACRATGLGRRMLSLSGPGAGGALLGLAVDLGTTTLAAALCDLSDGRIMALSSRSNPQAVRGDDVISRIDYAALGRDELREMRDSVISAVREMSVEACRAARVDGGPILAVIAGNAVMNHLFLGVSPTAMAASPFIPAFKGPIEMRGPEIGWDGDAPPLIHIMPNIAAYVGGDITAGLLAHDVGALDGVTLFLDVGTNGEIALAVDGMIRVCATAAGPAFEGARIRQGMRAAPGAISRVSLSEGGELELGVVGSPALAMGICGTGLLDAVTAMLAVGALDASGRIPDREEAREINPNAKPWVLSMLHEDEEGNAFWLRRPEGRGDPGVGLGQRDIREFQLAKGAVAAGVKVLLAEAGIGATSIDRVLLAGGFGNYLDPASAMAVGLLPAGIDRRAVKSIGNAALAGARLCLLSERERRAAAELSRNVRLIELSGLADFQRAFAEEMAFPDPFA